MRSLVITTVLKDEAPYIEEWVAYHIAQGVQKFYVYDNGSGPETIKILNKLQATSFLEWTPWTPEAGVHPQLAAWNDRLEKLKVSKYKDAFCAFIDIDEFLYPIEYGKTALQILNTIAPDEDAVCVPWMYFGSNGHKKKPSGLVLENYTRHSKEYNKHVKSICVPSRTISVFKDPHSFTTKSGFICKGDGYGDFHQKAHLQMQPKKVKLALCHFHTKSEAEYKTKCKKGRVGKTPTLQFATHFKMHDFNEVQYLQPSRFVGVTKLFMEQLK